jgi:glucokinase
MTEPDYLWLLADVGGTNTRLAMVNTQYALTGVKVYANTAFPGLPALIRAYLDETPARLVPRVAALAVACPVVDEHIRLLNYGWEFTVSQLKQALALEELHVINDFTAIAMSIPVLREQDKLLIGGGEPRPRTPIGIIGPGTGLGVSGLIPYQGGWVPLASEGGHVTLAPLTEEEWRIIDRLQQHVGHVSAERVLAGPGLINLYHCLAELDGEQARPVTPEQVSILATSRKDPRAIRALDLYFAMLGTVAGDLALTLGAHGGIYLAGGILPKLSSALVASRFRERFVDKGRYRDYLKAIPTYLITQPFPGLVGLMAFLANRQQSHG